MTRKGPAVVVIPVKPPKRKRAENEVVRMMPISTKMGVNKVRRRQVVTLIPIKSPYRRLYRESSDAVRRMFRFIGLGVR